MATEEITFTHMELCALDRGMCLAAAGYHSDAITAQYCVDRTMARIDEADARALMDKIGKYLAARATEIATEILKT